MYKILLRKPYGKHYTEIATFEEEWFAREFVDAVKNKLYDMIEIHKDEEIIYKSK